MSPNRQEELHVAIVGAGIAGLSLAIGLYEQGISFTLYEEAAQYSTVGAGIGFGPNGLLAMDLIHEGFRPRYEAICVGNKNRKDENVFFEGLLCREGLGLDEPWYGWSSWGAPEYSRKSAHRKELLDILTSFIPIEHVQFSKRLTHVQEHQDDRLELRFADGSVASATVLVGGDGIQSVVRKHVLSPDHIEQVEPVYAHSYAYRAVIPMEEARDILGDLTDTAKMYMGDKRVVVTYRVSGGKEFNFLHTVYSPSPWPSPESVTQKVSHDTMLEDFSNTDIDPRLLDLLKKAPPIRWGLFHHPHTATYVRSNVVLMGDGAHASLPYQAAGAGQGVEDALILGTVLGALKEGATGDVHKALQVYDEIRRPRAQRQLEQSLEASNLLSFQDEEAGDDVEKVLERMKNGRFEWLWFHDLKQDVERAKEMVSQRGGK